jgi:hypothetical protein
MSALYPEQTSRVVMASVHGPPDVPVFTQPQTSREVAFLRAENKQLQLELDGLRRAIRNAAHRTELAEAASRSAQFATEQVKLEAAAKIDELVKTIAALQRQISVMSVVAPTVQFTREAPVSDRVELVPDSDVMVFVDGANVADAQQDNTVKVFVDDVEFVSYQEVITPAAVVPAAEVVILSDLSKWSATEDPAAHESAEDTDNGTRTVALSGKEADSSVQYLAAKRVNSMSDKDLNKLSADGLTALLAKFNQPSIRPKSEAVKRLRSLANTFLSGE